MAFLIFVDLLGDNSRSTVSISERRFPPPGDPLEAVCFPKKRSVRKPGNPAKHVRLFKPM
jgi:hypothetical protein